jgi:DNA-binding NarL/FixJ family response regulator
MIRVLLVDPTPLLRSLWTAALSAEHNIRLVGVAATCGEALAQAADSDVMVISAGVSEADCLYLTRSLARSQPNVKVIVAGVPRSDKAVLRYVEMGAAGYVLEDGSITDTLRCIRAAHRNEADVAPELAPALMNRLAELGSRYSEVDGRGARYQSLTARERQVLELVARGCTNQEIAEALVIELGTVKNHVHNILEKLNMSSRLQAAAFLWAVEASRMPAVTVAQQRLAA